MVDASSFGHFEEVAGESEERRRARMGRFQRTQERAVCVSRSLFFLLCYNLYLLEFRSLFLDGCSYSLN